MGSFNMALISSASDYGVTLIFPVLYQLQKQWIFNITVKYVGRNYKTQHVDILYLWLHRNKSDTLHFIPMWPKLRFRKYTKLMHRYQVSGRNFVDFSEVLQLFYWPIGLKYWGNPDEKKKVKKIIHLRQMKNITCCKNVSKNEYFTTKMANKNV